MPMKPVFGKAATSAPKAASRRFTARPAPPARASAAVSRHHCEGGGGVDAEERRVQQPRRGFWAPKRNSMQGSAKNSTKTFRPGIAASGSARSRPAR